MDLIDAMLSGWYGAKSWEAIKANPENVEMVASIRDDAARALAAMCEGEALEEMVERGVAAAEALAETWAGEPVEPGLIREGIRAALTVQP